MGAAAIVRRVFPWPLRSIAPSHIQIFDRHRQHLGGDGSYARMRLGSDISNRDGQMNFAETIDPDESVAGATATQMFAAVNAKTASDASSLC
jgi:hypothetical protein